MSNRRKARPVSAPEGFKPCVDEVTPVSSPGLFIGYCSPGHVDNQFTASLLRFLMYDHDHEALMLHHGAFFAAETGPRLAHARNEIVRQFRKTGAQWLLMIDSDMAFEPHHPYQLIQVANEQKVGIVGGLCFAGGHSAAMFPTIYNFANEENRAKTLLSRYEVYPRDSLVQVDATGAAFTLIHRTVLDTMADTFGEPYPWYAETTRSGQQYGEDIAFCLRAGALGFKIVVDTRVKIKHYKRTALDEDEYLRRMVDRVDEHPDVQRFLDAQVLGEKVNA